MVFSLSSLWLRPTLQGSHGQDTGKLTSLEGKNNVHQYSISIVLCSIL